MSIFDFFRKFGTEEACFEYLVRIRWPKGYFCPVCGSTRASFITTRRLFKCENGHQVSPTAKTMMHKIHAPLRAWFYAGYIVATNTPGISALQLSRQLRMRYETVYMILQKLRAAMVNPDRRKLRGIVEVDETSIGGTEAAIGKGLRGRAYVPGRSNVIGAIEDHGRYAGRCRLRKVASLGSVDLLAFIKAHIEKGSIIKTDGFKAYKNLRRIGYGHVVVTGSTPKEVGQQIPKIHKTFSNLKSWIIGTHHGVSPKHLQAYLNEFTFRHNRRDTRAKDPMKAFNELLGIGTFVDAPEYRELYRSGEPGGWMHPNPPKKRRS